MLICYIPHFPHFLPLLHCRDLKYAKNVYTFICGCAFCLRTLPSVVTSLKHYKYTQCLTIQLYTSTHCNCKIIHLDK